MSRQTCKHGNTICSRCIVVTDAGKRISEGIRLAITFHVWEEIKNGWMAFALSDGQTDHTVYPSRQDAIRHQSDETRFLYIALRSCPSGMPEKDAEIFLEVNRHAYDASMRLSEPEAPQLIMPISRHSRFN